MSQKTKIESISFCSEQNKQEVTLSSHLWQGVLIIQDPVTEVSTDNRSIGCFTTFVGAEVCAHCGKAFDYPNRPLTKIQTESSNVAEEGLSYADVEVPEDDEGYQRVYEMAETAILSKHVSIEEFVSFQDPIRQVFIDAAVGLEHDQHYPFDGVCFTTDVLPTLEF